MRHEKNHRRTVGGHTPEVCGDHAFPRQLVLVRRHCRLAPFPTLARATRGSVELRRTKPIAVRGRQPSQHRHTYSSGGRSHSRCEATSLAKHRHAQKSAGRRHHSRREAASTRLVHGPHPKRVRAGVLASTIMAAWHIVGQRKRKSILNQ